MAALKAKIQQKQNLGSEIRLNGFGLSQTDLQPSELAFCVSHSGSAFAQSERQNNLNNRNKKEQHSSDQLGESD
jgi:hypothetical protein